MEQKGWCIFRNGIVTHWLTNLQQRWHITKIWLRAARELLKLI
jgi:hypothetical protein